VAGAFEVAAFEVAATFEAASTFEAAALGTAAFANTRPDSARSVPARASALAPFAAAIGASDTTPTVGASLARAWLARALWSPLPVIEARASAVPRAFAATTDGALVRVGAAFGDTAIEADFALVTALEPAPARA